jgi:hypothetical protein
VKQRSVNGAADDPAVPAESRSGVAADASDPGSDAAAAQVAADPRIVITLVTVQLDRPAPWVAAAVDRTGRCLPRAER